MVKASGRNSINLAVHQTQKFKAVRLEESAQEWYSYNAE